MDLLKEQDMEYVLQVEAHLMRDIDLNLECEEEIVVSSKVSNNSQVSIKIPVDANTHYKLTFPTIGNNLQQLPTRFGCSLCSKSFTRKTLLLDHKAKKHGLENLYSCTDCLYTGNLYPHLYKHVKRMHPTPISSMHGFSSNADSIPFHTLGEDFHNVECPVQLNHNSTCSATDELIDCVDDGAGLTGELLTSPHFPESGFSSESFLQDTIGIDRMPFGTTNSDISEPVASSSCLSPVQVHHEEQVQTSTYTCTSFSDENDSITAMGEATTSATLAVYECHYCPKVCKTKRKLKDHVRIHRQVYCHKCTQENCQSVFKTKSARNEHIHTVHGEKLYFCEHKGCTKKYAFERDLTAHLFQHSDAFACSWKGCRRRFRDQHNLCVHYKSHTAEKDHLCPHCEFTCVQKSSLNWHLSKMHATT